MIPRYSSPEMAAVFADTSGKALVVGIDPQRSAEEIIAASEDCCLSTTRPTPR